MKKSELRQIIREEVKVVLKESSDSALSLAYEAENAMIQSTVQSDNYENKTLTKLGNSILKLMGKYIKLVQDYD